MSMRSQNKSAKKRSHESLNTKADIRRSGTLSKCEVESLSGSCGSKKSNKKLFKDNKNQEGFFNVEKIIGLKVYQGQSFYKVRWQGYDECEDSWEPEDNLTNVMDLIEEFINNKEGGFEEDDNGKINSCTRTRTTGGYEYVPSNKVVACKTKYFDDIRDGKIDLTKNDLYSRVKTRKRLQSEILDDSEKAVYEVDSISKEIAPESINSSLCDKNKYYQVNLFEMTAEFMKNNNFEKSLTTLASKSSTNDDISSFNCSVSPDTNHSDDLLTHISPDQHQLVPECVTSSIATQTDINDIEQENEESMISENTMKPHLKKMISKINETLYKNVSREKLVTSESHLLSIYIKELKSFSNSTIVLPSLQTESDLITVDSFEDLKTAITLNKYNLLRSSLEGGDTFDWNRLFSPDNVSPLQFAVSKNQSNIVRLFLRYGAKVDYFQSEHCAESALMLASRCGYIHVVKALLDHNAFTDLRDHNGKNALFYAIENGRSDVVKMLLQHGTDFFKVAHLLSAVSLVNDLLLSNRLSSTTSLDLLSIIRGYYLSFINSLNVIISRYLTRQTAKQSCIIFPHRWVSVIEKACHIEFSLDESLLINLDTPILLLVHGVQADCSFNFWLDNNICCIDSVYLNDERQSSLTSANFVTTLWPLRPNNNIVSVQFTDLSLLSHDERQIRVAIVALSITTYCNNINSLNPSLHLPSHSRQYH